MPSAKLEKQASAETCDPIKNVLTIVEKKVRNLEKRKAKLDLYKQESQNGKELNDDQKKAVEKYEQVLEVLDFAKELQKQFQSVIQESARAQKKAAKREQLERRHEELQRIKELMLYQDLLNSMGGEDVRKDFLSGSNGAVQLTESELNNLDELYKAICPERDLDAETTSDFDEQLAAAADHVQALLDSRKKEVFGTTYKCLKETLQKIQTSTYFNKSGTVEETVEAECESNHSSTEEKDTEEKPFSEEQYAIQPEASLQSPVEDSILAQQSGPTVPQAERPYYMENSSLYTEQTNPIQEVLSIQGNLNFLQESQIEVESSQANSSATISHPVAPYPNAYTTTTQATSGSIPPQHRPSQRLSEEMAIAPTSVLIANSAAVPHQVPSNIAQVHIPTTGIVQPSTPAADFDPARPIPTQTYTNQSFTSAIHPMMSAVPQSYVPVTLPHGIPPPHALSQNAAVKQLVRPSAVQQQLEPMSTARVNPNVLSMAMHAQGSGMTAPSAVPQVPQQISIDMEGSQTVQSASIPSQFECSEIEEGNFIDDPNNTFTNNRNVRGVPRDGSRRGTNTAAYSKGTSQIGYGNDGAYQSTNNNQGYMKRESFAGDSSYSSNLKRGLNSRGAARGGNVPRGTSGPVAGPRAGYRN